MKTLNLAARVRKGEPMPKAIDMHVHLPMASWLEGFTPQVREKILYGNAKRILKL